MVARCIPESPRFAHRSERTVWEALRRQLPDGACLLHGVRFFGRDGDWEADLVVLYPDSGFATVEVKGGQVWHADGQWWQRTERGDKRIDPVEQARSASYLVGRYLGKRDEWRHGKVRSAHLVAFPDRSWGPDLESPATPREIVLTRDDLAEAAARIWDLFNGYLPDQPHQRPGLDAVHDAADLIGGRLEPQRDLAMRRDVRDDHVDRLTQDQYRILDLARDNPRIEVVGGPGTGKTWLALEQARRHAAAGRRVALVGFSRGLTTWLRRIVDGWAATERDRVWVGTYHALGVHWGADVPAERAGDAGFWEHELPARMADLAASLPDEQRFDAIVVDEAQDFADAWWPPLLASLADADEGALFICGDASQAVFGREGRPRVPLTRLRLDENLRNSQQIARVFRSLGEAPLEMLGGEGDPVRFVPCPTEDVYDEADRQAIALLEEGWDPGSIAVLTTHHRHPMQVERERRDGKDGLWSSLWDEDDYFYATVPGFKGLERPAVVLAVDGFRDPDLAREVLYVGLSRARDLLVVVGDLEVIAEVGGKELRKRLAKAADRS